MAVCLKLAVEVTSGCLVAARMRDGFRNTRERESNNVSGALHLCTGSSVVSDLQKYMFGGPELCTTRESKEGAWSRLTWSDPSVTPIDPTLCGEVLPMRKQRLLFTQPFRKSYRHRRTPRLSQMKKTKKRKRMQAFRRQKTVRLVGDTRGKKGTIDWSPEQLKRIWRKTAG